MFLGMAGQQVIFGRGFPLQCKGEMWQLAVFLYREEFRCGIWGSIWTFVYIFDIPISNYIFSHLGTST